MTVESSANIRVHNQTLNLFLP